MAEDMDILVGVKVDGTEADIQAQVDRLASNTRVKAGVSLSLDKPGDLQKTIDDAVNHLTRPTIFVKAELEKGALDQIKQQIIKGLSGNNAPAVDLSKLLFGGQNVEQQVQKPTSQAQKAVNKVTQAMQKMSEVSFRVTDKTGLEDQLKRLGVKQADVDAIVKQIEQGGFKIQQAQAKFAQRVSGRGKNKQLSRDELLQSLTISGQTADGVDAVKTVTYNGSVDGYVTSTSLGMTLNEQGKVIQSAKQATSNQKQINSLLSQLNELQHKAFDRSQPVQGDSADNLSAAFDALTTDLELGNVDVESARNRLNALKTLVKDVQSAQKAASKLKNVSVANKVAEVESAVETRRQEANRLVGALNADNLTAEAQKVQDALTMVDQAFATAQGAGKNATSEQWNAYTKAVDDYRQAVKQALQARRDFENQQKLQTQGSDLVQNLTKSGMANEAASVQAALDGVTKAVNQLQNSTDPADLQEYARAMSELEDAVSANEAALKKHNNDQAIFDKAKKDLQTVVKIRNEWSKAMADPSNAEWLNTINDGLQSVDASQVKKASQELRVFQAQMKATGQATETFGAKMKRFFKEFTQWFSVSQIIMNAIQGVKSMISTVTEIDASMTELKKVTNETATSYEQFSKRAAASAKDLKTSITDVVDATSGWSRLGYGLKESEALGKWSTIYANVGDDIASVDDATQNLVSTLKGFGTEGNTVVGQVERIVHMFNKVGNSTSISSGKIGESLQNSASAMKEANNTLSETVALTVGAYDVTQSAGEVGNMWKTVSMRIRGAKTELEAAGEDTADMVESTAKLRDYVKGMTGFDILKSADEFKSTYDIVIGIGKVWKDLSDIEQASLLDKLAGKNRANALAAALNNVEEIERAYKLAEESAGSATAEYDVYTQSVEAHAKQMEASMQAFSKSALSTDVINAGYDMGSGLLDMLTGIADVLGSIPTLATAAMTAVTLFTGKGRSSVIYAPLREAPLAA